MPVDENEALIAERSSLYATLGALGDDEWDAASLCTGWRTRDVASHVELLATSNPAFLILGIVRNRGDFDRFMASAVPPLGDRPAGEILDAWAPVAASTSIPPLTKRVEQALDCFVHHHDIAIPLERDVPVDAARLRWMADGLVAAGSPIRSGARVEGLRLIATDIDWHYGTGAEVRGPAAALLLAGCGRRALDDQLEGDGLETLVERSEGG